MCPNIRCTSSHNCMSNEGTQTQCVAMRLRAPPSYPTTASVSAPASFAYSTAFTTLGELPLPLIATTLGLFALPEIFVAIEKKASPIIDTANLKISGARLKWAEFKSCLRTIIRSTAIGTSIGMIPGVGQVVAAFMGYAAAKSASKTAEPAKKLRIGVLLTCGLNKF